MGRIPDHIIQEVRDRIDIVDLVGRYVNLRRAGASYKGLCPFHDEKTPSFNVSPDRQIFHCFGCQAGGDAFRFVVHHENLTFPEAVRTLAREVGVEVPEEHSGERGISERVLAALEVARDVFRAGLEAPEAAPARVYLEGRGLDADLIAQLGLGFAPEGWEILCDALARKGIDAAVGEQAGLLVPRRRGGGHYDRLRGRITFPIQDARGRVIAFGGRALGPDQEPKYLNTSESPVFHKRAALYGLPHALEPMRRRSRAVVCEGYFDRIALQRAGIGEAVATCGTALTADHARQLSRRTREVVLLFDGDTAGVKAADRALEVLLPAGLRVRHASLPAGEDPDDFLVRCGAEALSQLVDRAEDALESAMRRALAAGCHTPAQKADAVATVAPLVARVSDPVERGEYARRLASATDVDTRAVERVVRDAGRGRDLGRSAREQLEPAVPLRSDSGLLEARHLRQLAAVVFHHPELADASLIQRIEQQLPAGAWRALALELCAAARRGELDESGRVDVFGVEARLDEELRPRLREIALEETGAFAESPPADVLEDLLRWFSKRLLAAESRSTTQRLKDPSADAATLLREKQRQLEARRHAQRRGSGPVR